MIFCRLRDFFGNFRGKFNFDRFVFFADCEAEEPPSNTNIFGGLFNKSRSASPEKKSPERNSPSPQKLNIFEQASPKKDSNSEDAASDSEADEESLESRFPIGPRKGYSYHFCD